ncbi:hypothetical protein ACP275_08G206000 [Erythranthe tilingii]
MVNFKIPFCLATNSTTLATDQSALLALKSQITLDPYYILAKNWTNSSSVCNWIGVTCGSRHRRVAALNISDMSLSGTIPPQLGNLSFLVSLDLSYNLLGGVLPKQLSLLRRLKFVSLDVNDFGGEIPSWLGLLPKLEYLSLRNNSFAVFVPGSLSSSNVSNLQEVDFSFNSLQGNVPEDLGRLRNLRHLRIQYNYLSGPIPLAIFNISTLKTVALTGNELSGGLPSDMCSNLPLVRGIYLSQNKLTGEIPSNISRCSQLREISLSYNSFSGHIPREIGKLKFLRFLYLGLNNLNGVIPQEIANLRNLVGFSIGINQISGAVPLNIFNMSSLQYLGLRNNKLTGSLPSNIGNLTNLKYSYFSYNNLTGVLPREINKLYQLDELALQFNAFTGSIPIELFNMSNLRALSLTSNGLSGALPTNPDHGLCALEVLLLGNNYFNGAIPHSIINCSKLRILDIGYNNFSGFVPHFFGELRLLQSLNFFRNNLRTESPSSELSFITSLTNCRSLNSLVIDNNPLDGIIPNSIGNFSTSFQRLIAVNCKLKGKIPAEIGNLSNLAVLSLADNELSSNIPLSIENLHNLQGLYLGNNSMSGSIPDGLCDSRSLIELSLRQNKFSGQIPECLGNITSLNHLFLDSNVLTSSIPSSLWSLKYLLTLELSNNSLSGPLPSEIGNLVNAVVINLSTNRLVESIPTTVGNLIFLTHLLLANNRLEGSIPESVGSMIGLVNLDLSYNNLSGSIPKSLEALQYLDYFNVSFNVLRGEIPNDGPFRNFTMDSFIGNEALCGIPRFGVPFCRSVFKRGPGVKRARLALFIFSGVVALTLFLCFAIVVFVRHKRKDTVVREIDGVASTVLERISYYELLQATEQFGERNLLGTGSFGSVYRGVLRDGNILAVKVFNSLSEAASKSFDVECEVLRNIRHRNLAKVISSCSNEDFKALVLEYMPNGNLDTWLYSQNYCLDLMQRLDIVIDVACALEYLHHGYSTPIVHCDLKPSNVLLDEEMVAHVSDFGIAKLMGDGESVVHTNTLATLGYIAPEYGFEGLVSTRCDVYSYGVMVMETFTRKRPCNDLFGGDLTLKSWVESSLDNESLSLVIDASLLIPEKAVHIEKDMQCVSSILELALKCSAESPRDRINMKEVLGELVKIRKSIS